MLRVLTALFACAIAQAATSSATLTVNATLAISGSTNSASGTATLTGGIAASGTFSAPAVNLSGGATAYTITTSSGTLAGSLTIPQAVLASILGGASSASGASATITSATGSYAGDTGTFPNLSGSGSISGVGAINVTFSGAGTVTTGGTVTNPAPTITAVENDATNDFGTPGTIAQGSLFVIKGSNMSASGYVQTSVPYPTSSGSTSVAFTPTGGGSPTAPYLFYTYNVSGVNQIGAILPSTLKTGTYNVTVTYNSVASAPFSVTVVATSPGIFTQDTSGSGLGVVQNIISATQYDVDRLTTGTVGGYTVSPAKPGQTIIVWATGLGAVPYADNIVPPQAFNYPSVQVIIGGTSITPLYAGASGYPGLDQINVTLPSNITTGCTVSLQISVNGTLSAGGTISIAPNTGANACVAPGFTSSQLQSLDNGGTITSGSFQISQIQESVPSLGSIKIDSASGGFASITAFQLNAAPLNPSSVTSGSCTVTTVTIHGNVVSAGGAATGLDAGAVTLSGPAGTNLSNTALTESSNSYSLTIGEEGISIPGGLNGTITAGKYTLNGAGGKDVGSFSTSITLGSPLTLTAALPTVVSRSSPLVLAWTGGNSTDPVQIFGYSGTSSGSGASAVTTATEFMCATTAGTGGFTVPASILSQLPATAASAAGGTGLLEVASGPTPTSFTAPLTGSSSVTAFFSGIIGTGGLVSYQ